MTAYSSYADTELVRLLRTGNELAYTALYNRYSEQLFRKMWRMTNDKERAKELLQDLFMKLWENREQIDPARSFKSYLYTAAINLVYDHFRRAARNHALASHLFAMAIDHYTHIEEMLIHKDNIALIRNSIEKLPPQRKQVFIKCKLEGKSYEEVSNELSISTSTIRDHMVKANRVVKAYLRGHPDLALYSLVAIAFFQN